MDVTSKNLVEVSTWAKHLTWCVQSRCTDHTQRSSALYYFGGATSRLSWQKLRGTSQGTNIACYLLQLVFFPHHIHDTFVKIFHTFICNVVSTSTLVLLFHYITINIWLCQCCSLFSIVYFYSWICIKLCLKIRFMLYINIHCFQYSIVPSYNSSLFYFHCTFYCSFPRQPLHLLLFISTPKNNCPQKCSLLMNNLFSMPQYDHYQLSDWFRKCTQRSKSVYRIVGKVHLYLWTEKQTCKK